MLHLLQHIPLPQTKHNSQIFMSFGELLIFVILEKIRSTLELTLPTQIKRMLVNSKKKGILNLIMPS